MIILTPTVLVDGLQFPEGPRWHEGRLWFSDMNAQKVMTVDLSGHLQTIVQVPGSPSGLGWLPDGRLLVVSMTDRRLLRFEDGKLAQGFPDKSHVESKTSITKSRKNENTKLFLNVHCSLLDVRSAFAKKATAGQVLDVYLLISGL